MNDFTTLPDPDVLARYDVMCPGSAERILKMVEEQAAHRLAMERAAFDIQVGNRCKQNNAALRGRVFTFLIIIALICAGLYIELFLRHWFVGNVFNAAALVVAGLAEKS